MPTFIKAGFWEKRTIPVQGYKGELNLDQLIAQNGSHTSGTSGTSGLQGAQGAQGVQGSQGIQGTQGIQGVSGSAGTSGSSGAAGDRYQTTSSTSFTLGTSTTLTIGTGLAYTPAQDIIITYDVNNHQVCTVVSYNPGTGALVIGPPITVVGSGTYSSWTVNLDGAAGGDGSSGTSGSNGSSGTSGLQGSQGIQGLQGVAGSNGTSGTNGTGGSSGSSGSSGYTLLTGNTLFVDAVYGNDTLALLNPNAQPFLTISAALAVATSGTNVSIHAGTYNESITIPSGVCVTGISSQSVIIQKLAVVANTTLVTMNTNSRLENVTCNLTSSGNYNLTGVEFATGASINSKIRTSVINVTSTTTNGPTIIGVLSAGTSSTSYSSSDAIARTTINVISSSTGVSKGVYISGANRLTIRETSIYARGTGSNIIGFEINNASGVAEIRTSSVNGVSNDVKRTLGTMLIGATDLVNNTAGGNSFTATQAPASFSFGTINGLGTNRRYYMLTGTVPVGQLENEATSNSYDPAKALPVPVTQVSLIIALTMAYQPTLPGGTSISLNIYKNSSLTPEITLTMLPADGGIKRLDTQSFSLSATDVIRVTIETVGNLGPGGAFQAVIGYY
jgi:hypothetical protein